MISEEVVAEGRVGVSCDFCFGIMGEHETIVCPLEKTCKEDLCASCLKKGCACGRLINLLAVDIALQFGGLPKILLKRYGLVDIEKDLKKVAIGSRQGWTLARWEFEPGEFYVIITSEGFRIFFSEDDAAEFAQKVEKVIWEGSVTSWPLGILDVMRFILGARFGSGAKETSRAPSRAVPGEALVETSTSSNQWQQAGENPSLFSFPTTIADLGASPTPINPFFMGAFRRIN